MRGSVFQCVLPGMGEEAELRCPEALSGELEGVAQPEAPAVGDRGRAWFWGAGIQRSQAVLLRVRQSQFCLSFAACSQHVPALPSLPP